MYISFLLSYCPFHWACRIPAELYCDPAEFGLASSLAHRLTRGRGGLVVPLGAKLARERVRVAVGTRRDAEAGPELADEMRDAAVPHLFRDAGDRKLAVDRSSRARSRRISLTN
jgi:hypothetical protein